MSFKDITLEDLGFSSINYSNCILYERETTDEYIWFYKGAKTIEISFDITIKELQAIYNKCKDLGWLDDNN